MTLEQLQNIVLRLANNGWCRFWVHRNYPQNPVKMAVQVQQWSDGRFQPARVQGMEEKGFAVEDCNVHGENWIYVIPRTDDNGYPYESKLV